MDSGCRRAPRYQTKSSQEAVEHEEIAVGILEVLEPSSCVA
jgi:hypothetical protein